MAEERVQRRLAAILAADVVGYLRRGRSYRSPRCAPRWADVLELSLTPLGGFDRQHLSHPDGVVRVVGGVVTCAVGMDKDGEPVAVDG